MTVGPFGYRLPYNVGTPYQPVVFGQQQLSPYSYGMNPLTAGASPGSTYAALANANGVRGLVPSLNVGGNGLGSLADQLGTEARSSFVAPGARGGFSGATFGAASAPTVDAAVPWSQLLLKGREGAAGLAGKGLLARGSLALIGGPIAAGAAKQATGSDLLSAVAGGGTAGAIIGAPFGGVGAVPGWAIGALAGGTLGVANQELGLGLENLPVIGGIFGSGGGGEKPAGPTEPKMRATIRQLATQLDTSTRSQVHAALRASKSLPEEERSAYLKQLLVALPDEVGAAAKEKAQVQKQLAVQMQVAKAMAELSQSSTQLGDASAQTIRGLIPSVDPRLAPIMEYDAAQREAFGRQASIAYQGAALAQPAIDAFQAQIAQLNQINQQMQAQGGGGTQSLASQLGYGG